jgi:hypothetical protein
MNKQTNWRKLKQSFISTLIFVAALALLSETGLRADGQTNKVAGSGGPVPAGELPAVDKSKAKPAQPPAFDKRKVTSLDAGPEQPKRVLGEGPVPTAEQRTGDKSSATPSQTNAINKATPAQPNVLKK